VTREFDLNIEGVLQNWMVAHALREVIAKALEEQVLTGARRCCGFQAAAVVVTENDTALPVSRHHGSHR
jgi:hypothetical protein